MELWILGQADECLLVFGLEDKGKEHVIGHFCQNTR